MYTICFLCHPGYNIWITSCRKLGGLRFIANYLSNRKQRGVIKGSYSDWTYIKSGVPQDSILGPLLFLIYTNDIESDIFLFADDTAILEPLSLGILFIDKVNRDLERLNSWASQCPVQFNPIKTNRDQIPIFF